MKTRHLLPAVAGCSALLLFAACDALSSHAFYARMADLYAPAALVDEGLFFEFHGDHVMVRANFTFACDANTARVPCRFPGTGYPVTHGLAAGIGAPDRLPVPPEHFRAVMRVPGSTSDQPLTVVRGKNGEPEFTVDFTSPLTTVRISYQSRYARLPDGRRCFIYILTSGAYWRGPIGSLVVRETFSRGLHPRRLWPVMVPNARVEPDFDLVYALD